MRILSQLSVTFLVINAMTKDPINNAIISCNGKPGGYISKGEGYYVYTNLENYKYRFEVRCQGFAPQFFEIDLSKNTEYNNVCLMYYSVSSAKLLSVNKPICLATLNGNPLENTAMKIIQGNKVATLRISDTVEDKMNCIELNCGYNRGVLYQFYSYGMECEKELFISDYDDEKKAYLTDTIIPEKIKISTLLKPMWKIVTDEKGLFVLPISGVFTTDNIVNFTIKYKEQSKSINVERSNTSKILHVDF